MWIAKILYEKKCTDDACLARFVDDTGHNMQHAILISRHIIHSLRAAKCLDRLAGLNLLECTAIYNG